ncbi:homologous recombination OB-fold protein isoform X1 [Osmerus mordax]|uniref:homologous recombination OB-fold protein isoform X1 n=1 Tax=Osmerus mordax TaxID=8014 RepID=UPI00350FED85
MTAIMQTCKFNGLFDVGEDFDDEDLLEADWYVPSVSAAANAASESSDTRHPDDRKATCQLQTEGSLSLRNLQTGQGSVALRQLSTPGSKQTDKDTSADSVPCQGQSQPNHLGKGVAPWPQDEFDDWDLDLAELDETDPQLGHEAHVKQVSTAPASSIARDKTVSSAKRLCPSACGGAQTLPSVGLRGFSTSNQKFGLPNSNPPLRSSTPVPSLSSGRPVCTAPAQSPGVVPGAPPFSSHFPRAVTPRPPRGLQQLHRPTASPAAHGQSLFDAISPAPSVRCGAPMPSPRSLHTPVLTNHLVQLVSASNRTPRRPRSDHARPRTRRFPGPAGLLPQQPQGHSLDDIVVALPQTPAHGAVARLPCQVPSSQCEEEDCTGGPWAAMKAEMGLDERNPSCFLHSYSVVMVLRKAALKQLAQNKVPNMAVVLKSIIHTHADAKAVFRDPTGEIQGTVHRRLLEDRLGELRAGAVLLLKQVGVFSPSHRNHYLNVTPNNLLRIYPPDGVAVGSACRPTLLLEPVLLLSGGSSTFPEAPVSQMELHFDEEEDGASRSGSNRVSDVVSQEAVGAALQDPDQAWGADDDLDDLLVELPVESYSL